MKKHVSKESQDHRKIKTIGVWKATYQATICTTERINLIMCVGEINKNVIFSFGNKDNDTIQKCMGNWSFSKHNKAYQTLLWHQNDHRVSSNNH